MQLAKVRRSSGEVAVVIANGDEVYPLDLSRRPGVTSLADILHNPDPDQLVDDLVRRTAEPAAGLTFLAPVDRQEVWAAGVTYKRSKIAREEESKGAAQFYDKVYAADRPELFLKATPERVVGPGQPVRVRSDSKWSVPEPELALVISPAGRIVGFTVGNDVDRDIEGENPLYLPQAKIYKQSCSVGPVVTVPAAMPPWESTRIRLVIRRAGAVAFDGTTTLGQMARTPEQLAGWLFRENEFPHGAVLLTGTGIVPPDEFTLASGDAVAITIDGIGTLHNPVA